MLNDYDTVLFIKHGIREDVSMISNRYAKANNEYMPCYFDPNKDSKFIVYVDSLWFCNVKMSVYAGFQMDDRFE